MNPIDMTFEEKVEQVTKANRIPSGQGFNFLRFQEIGLHQIVQRTGNVLANAVRSQGLDLEYVAAFTDRINEGRYFFTYEQPVVKPLGIKNEEGEVVMLSRGDFLEIAAHRIEIIDIVGDIVLLDLDGRIVSMQAGESVQKLE